MDIGLNMELPSICSLLYCMCPEGDFDLYESIESQLVLRHSSDKRHYHNISHVYQCIKDLSKVVNPLVDYFKLSLIEFKQIEYALWFHDAVYNIKSMDNEEKSADLAYNEGIKAKLSEPFLHGVKKLIRATKHDKDPENIYEAYIIDIDLAILGKDPITYKKYKNGIRNEYASIPDKQFKEGRSAVLKKFIDRKKIYNTPLFFDEYEEEARYNLEREIKELEKL